MRGILTTPGGGQVWVVLDGGVLDTDTLKAHARLFECRATLK